MIHKTELGYVISAYNTWLPGVYADRKSANYAFRFRDEDLRELMDYKNKTDGNIEFKDLQELKQKLKKIITYQREES